MPADETITVTEAARNLSDYLNRVRYQNTSFTLLKNGTPVARIVPPASRKRLTGPEIAAALRKVRPSDEDLRSWRKDLEDARKSLLPVEDKWK